MSAVPAPSVGALQTSSSSTFRTLLNARRAEGRRMSLDDVIAVLVPVCMDVQERHARGEKLFVHPSAIVSGPDGLMRGRERRWGRLQARGGRA